MEEEEEEEQDKIKSTKKKKRNLYEERWREKTKEKVNTPLVEVLYTLAGLWIPFLWAFLDWLCAVWFLLLDISYVQQYKPDENEKGSKVLYSMMSLWCHEMI